MALNVARGFLNTTTAAAGNTVVVAGLGFQPKAVFFWWNGRTDTADAVGRRTQQTGFGYAVSTTDRRYATCLAQDTPTAMVTNRMQGNAACIGITTTGAAIDGLMDLQSMDSGGFTLVIDDAFVASYTVHYLALGGTDIVNVGGNDFTMALVTGNQDVEQVAFLPNFIMFFSDGQQTINNSVSADSGLTIGAAKSSSNRYVLTGGSNDASANAQSVSYAIDTECIALLNSGVTATESRADFVDFHSSPANGFRINWLSNAGSAKIIAYLAIQFTNANYAVLGDLLTQTDTTTDIVESGFPFMPLGGMFLSANRAKSTANTVTDDHELSIGAFTSTASRSAAGMMDDDAAGTAVVGTAVEFDAVYVNLPNTAATVEGLMDIKSVDSSGFTAIMDDADPVQAFVWYMVFGPENVTIQASVGTIASAGRTASITPGGVTVQASAGTIASAGQTATVSTGGGGQTVTCTAGVIASAGQTAVIIPGAISVQASAGILDSAGQPATITPGAVSIATTAATLDTNGEAATISNVVTVQASTGAITAGGHAATITPGAVTVQTSAGSIAIAGQTAAVQPGAVSITANAAILDSEGFAATVSSSSGATIQASAGAITVSGQTAAVLAGAVTVQASAAIIDSNGVSASIQPGAVIIAVDTAVISISGLGAMVAGGSGEVSDVRYTVELAVQNTHVIALDEMATYSITADVINTYEIELDVLNE